MNCVRKTYIEFRYPGVLFIENSIEEVQTREVSKVKVPRNAFGFKFFDLLSVVVEADGEQVQLTSERLNESPIHYYGGKLYTIEELKHEFPNERTLIGNLDRAGRERAIRCRTGNWQAFDETSVFVEEAA